MRGIFIWLAEMFRLRAVESSLEEAARLLQDYGLPSRKNRLAFVGVTGVEIRPPLVRRGPNHGCQPTDGSRFVADHNCQSPTFVGQERIALLPWDWMESDGAGTTLMAVANCGREKVFVVRPLNSPRDAA